jgi:site-specific recombinase XerD
MTLLVSKDSRLAAAGLSALPAIIGSRREKDVWRFLEFFVANIANDNTRRAYAQAIGQFFRWCESRHLDELEQLRPAHVSAYVRRLEKERAAPTVKQHLAAIRMLFDWLIIGQVLAVNPAAAVRGPKHVVKTGKTPILSPEETRQLLDAIDTSTIGGLRDRALIGVLVYSFARISAALGMNVEDFYIQQRRSWFRLHEKGGKEHQVPAHHNADAYLHEYIAAAGIADQKKGPLFRTLMRAPGRPLGLQRLSRTEAIAMIRRRARRAGIATQIGCHTFRATGITTYLLNGGSLEHAQQIAAHESPRTTKLYDRTHDEITLDEIERILI